MMSWADLPCFLSFSSMSVLFNHSSLFVAWADSFCPLSARCCHFPPNFLRFSVLSLLVLRLACRRSERGSRAIVLRAFIWLTWQEANDNATRKPRGMRNSSFCSYSSSSSPNFLSVSVSLLPPHSSCYFLTFV